MNAKHYHFANYIWIEYLFARNATAHIALRSAIVSLIPWFIGLALASYFDHLYAYLRTPAFYYGSLGIAIALFGMGISAPAQYTVYDAVLKCFFSLDADRRRIVKQILAINSNSVDHLIWSLLVFIALLLLAAFAFLYWPLIEPFSRAIDTRLPRFHAFDDHGWYDPDNSTLGFTLVIPYLFMISAALGTSGILMLRLPLFFFQLSRFTPIIPPLLIKHHFVPITQFYARFSILWLAGVMTIVLFAGPNRDWLTMVFIGYLILLGFVNFLIPQFVYAACIRAAETVIQKSMAQFFYENEVPLITKNIEAGSPKTYDHLSILESLTSFLAHDRWVYPVHQTYVVAITYILSVIQWERIYSAFDRLLG